MIDLCFQIMSFNILKSQKTSPKLDSPTNLSIFIIKTNYFEK